MSELRRLLRTSAERAVWNDKAAIDASGFQRDQTSHHYHNRAGYSFHSLKTVLLKMDGIWFDGLTIITGIFRSPMSDICDRIDFDYFQLDEEFTILSDGNG